MRLDNIDQVLSDQETKEARQETKLDEKEGSDMQKVQDGLFYAKKEEDLFFAFERVYGNNENWIYYAEKQIRDRRTMENFIFDELHGGNLSDTEDKEFIEKLFATGRIVVTVATALERFYQCLKYKGNADIWVTYVSNKKPSRVYNHESDWKCIEMAAAVVTHEKVPLQVHEGVFRSVSFLKESLLKKNVKKHIKISHLLHSFAALAMKFSGKENSHMIITPTTKMKEILMENLPVGSYHKNARQVTVEEKGKNSCIFLGKNGEKILELKGNGKKMDVLEEYEWIFDHVVPGRNRDQYFIVPIDELANIF